jgi:hypothetical protein
LAFGDGPNNTHDVGLWTSDPAGDDVTIRFIQTGPGAKASDIASFGSFELRQIDSGSEPVETTSLVPFRARVKSDVPALLETPRMFMPGYMASVDGHQTEVFSSKEALVSIPVEAGVHSVLLWFAGPSTLRFSYWLAICAWTSALLLGAFAGLRPRN